MINMVNKPNDPEVARLKDVYRNYQESGMAQVKWSLTNPGNQAMLRERNEGVRQLLKENGFFPLTARKVLDVGCGRGEMLEIFRNWGALPENLHGVDILPERIDAAKQSFQDIHFQVANAEQLTFASQSFDLALLFTVFTSILDNQVAQRVAREVRRVLKTGGAVVWYDFRYNNPRNPQVRGMTSEMIRAFFPDFHLTLHKITLWPALARRLGGLTPLLYPLLVSLPWLRTHYLGLLVKP